MKQKQEIQEIANTQTQKVNPFAKKQDPASQVKKDIFSANAVQVEKKKAPIGNPIN